MSRVGGQLATGIRRAPDRLHVFHIDSGGVLRCAAQDGPTWAGVTLPQADGLPFGTDLHPPGALMTGYQARGAQLDVFAVDRDGMLRIYFTTQDARGKQTSCRKRWASRPVRVSPPVIRAAVRCWTCSWSDVPATR